MKRGSRKRGGQDPLTPPLDTPIVLINNCQSVLLDQPANAMAYMMRMGSQQSRFVDISSRRLAASTPSSPPRFHTLRARLTAM